MILNFHFIQSSDPVRFIFIFALLTAATSAILDALGGIIGSLIRGKI